MTTDGYMEDTLMRQGRESDATVFWVYLTTRTCVLYAAKILLVISSSRELAMLPWKLEASEAACTHTERGMTYEGGRKKFLDVARCSMPPG